MCAAEGRYVLTIEKHHLVKSCGETVLMFSTHSVPNINTEPAVYGPVSAGKDGKMTCEDTWGFGWIIQSQDYHFRTRNYLRFKKTKIMVQFGFNKPKLSN